MNRRGTGSERQEWCYCSSSHSSPRQSHSVLGALKASAPSLSSRSLASRVLPTYLYSGSLGYVFLKLEVLKVSSSVGGSASQRRDQVPVRMFCPGVKLRTSKVPSALNVKSPPQAGPCQVRRSLCSSAANSAALACPAGCHAAGAVLPGTGFFAAVIGAAAN